MKKVALLIDGGWFSLALGKLMHCPNNWPTAAQVISNARRVVGPDEEIFRIYYYDCEPYEKTVKNPIDGSSIDYKAKAGYPARKKFFFELGQSPLVALRRGILKARGWELSQTYKNALMTPGTPHAAPGPADVYPVLMQKGVDMRIGIDVATLVFKNAVDRIILFSGDTDMIPALKLARREALQIYIVKVEPWSLRHELIEDCDGVRSLTPVP